jgi:hypothetical protein
VCAAVTCLEGSQCEEVDGEAVCVPNAPSVCAAVTCLEGNQCEEVDGEAVCVPNAPSGPFCGGFAGIACPGAGICADDPNDGCDPDNGGADCGGSCVCPVIALCIPGLVFDESPDVCECVPAPEANPCALVDCFPNQICEVQDGEAVCVPVPPNPCAAVTCLRGQVCVADGDEARCEPIIECN